MSRTWWDSNQTTSGHGIFSQYKPDHLKEWVKKETRRQDRASSPQRVPSELTATRSSLFGTMDSKPVERLHNSNAKTLADLRNFMTPPGTPGVSQRLTEPRTESPAEHATRSMSQPLFKPYTPSTAHHHHYGWNPPTPQQHLGGPSHDPRLGYTKYGDALSYCHTVTRVNNLISTRKP